MILICYSRRLKVTSCIACIFLHVDSTGTATRRNRNNKVKQQQQQTCKTKCEEVNRIAFRIIQCDCRCCSCVSSATTNQHCGSLVHDNQRLNRKNARERERGRKKFTKPGSSIIMNHREGHRHPHTTRHLLFVFDWK